MQYMEAKDYKSAYALLSPRAQRQYPLSNIKQFTEGNYYVLYEGYQSFSVQSINISLTVNPDENLPQGTVAEVSGTITYEGNFQGTFNGTLEKVGDFWKIYGIFVNVSPDKFGP